MSGVTITTILQMRTQSLGQHGFSKGSQLIGTEHGLEPGLYHSYVLSTTPHYLLITHHMEEYTY